MTQPKNNFRKRTCNMVATIVLQAFLALTVQYSYGQSILPCYLTVERETLSAKVSIDTALVQQAFLSYSANSQIHKELSQRVIDLDKKSQDHKTKSLKDFFKSFVQSIIHISLQGVKFIYTCFDLILEQSVKIVSYLVFPIVKFSVETIFNALEYLFSSPGLLGAITFISVFTGLFNIGFIAGCAAYSVVSITALLIALKLLPRLRPMVTILSLFVMLSTPVFSLSKSENLNLEAISNTAYAQTFTEFIGINDELYITFQDRGLWSDPSVSVKINSVGNFEFILHNEAMLDDFIEILRNIKQKNKGLILPADKLISDLKKIYENYVFQSRDRIGVEKMFLFPRSAVLEELALADSSEEFLKKASQIVLQTSMKEMLAIIEKSKTEPKQLLYELGGTHPFYDNKHPGIGMLAYYAPQAVVRLLDDDFEQTAQLIIEKPGHTSHTASVVLAISNLNLPYAVGIVERMKDKDVGDFFKGLLFRIKQEGHTFNPLLVTELSRVLGEETVTGYWGQAQSFWIDAANEDIKAAESRLEELRQQEAADPAKLFVRIIDAAEEYANLRYWVSATEKQYLTVEEKEERDEAYKRADQLFEHALELSEHADQLGDILRLARWYAGEKDNQEIVDTLYNTAIEKELYLYDGIENHAAFQFGNIYYDIWKYPGRDTAAKNRAEYFFNIWKQSCQMPQPLSMEQFYLLYERYDLQTIMQMDGLDETLAEKSILKKEEIILSNAEDDSDVMSDNRKQEDPEDVFLKPIQNQERANQHRGEDPRLFGQYSPFVFLTAAALIIIIMRRRFNGANMRGASLEQELDNELEKYVDLITSEDKQPGVPVKKNHAGTNLKALEVLLKNKIGRYPQGSIADTLFIGKSI